MSETSVPPRGSSRSIFSREIEPAEHIRRKKTPPWARPRLTSVVEPLTDVTPEIGERPTIRGKYFFADGEKLWIRGVTYGAFLADENRLEYQDVDQIERDFAQMAASGINTVRIPHTTPPRHLLDIAWRNDLRVMIGLSAEQYAGYLIDRAKAPDIEAIIRERVRSVAGHPALLCYGLGNEIQAPVARWIGRRRLEKFLERMYDVVKAEDPDGLVTYVNYPSTEYLSLPFLDFYCFNVYLETQERLSSYLGRLQNLSGDKPLVMGELGLDSMRNGEAKQAEILDWQIRTSFAEGCAGTFVFAWTDEWYRGKERVEDWEFGVVRADRSPKPALASISRAFSEIPFVAKRKWPKASVVVCTYNGAKTLESCLESLAELDYPNFEVIVVDDGSRDESAAIASRFDVQLITTKNMGLSSARNTGAHAATGEIVAYMDDDACADPHWLKYIVDTFESGSDAAVGGPNIPPGDGTVVADSVENAPGGPVHVLISDREAEHVPGCNMAFRREALLAIGGFDTQFRTAGDDVDVCWRILEKGWTIGFNPGAVVTHHRRKSIRTYWRQQWGYGKAEAQLEKKWPEKYNSAGHVSWSGRLYGKGLSRLPGVTARIYHGVWGIAPYQLLYAPTPGGVGVLPLMPEWYLLSMLLAGVSVLGILWTPLLFALPLLGLTMLGAALRAVVSASSASFPNTILTRRERMLRFSMTAFLYLIQPMARLGGRLKEGLSPFRSRESASYASPWPRRFTHWTSEGESQENRLTAIEAHLREAGMRALRGGAFDSWDLEALGGIFGAARLQMAVEEHGGGHQFVRVRYRPQWRRLGVFLALQVTLLSLALWASTDAAYTVVAIFALASVALAALAIRDFCHAMAALDDAWVPQVAESKTSGAAAGLSAA